MHIFCERSGGQLFEAAYMRCVLVANNCTTFRSTLYMHTSFFAAYSTKKVLRIFLIFGVINFLNQWMSLNLNVQLDLSFFRRYSFLRWPKCIGPFLWSRHSTWRCMVKSRWELRDWKKINNIYLWASFLIFAESVINRLYLETSIHSLMSEYIYINRKFINFILEEHWFPRRKRFSQSLAKSHVYNPIRDSGETLAESLGETLGESFRARQASPQSLGSDYMHGSPELSSRIVFFALVVKNNTGSKYSMSCYDVLNQLPTKRWRTFGLWLK